VDPDRVPVLALNPRAGEVTDGRPNRDSVLVAEGLRRRQRQLLGANVVGCVHETGDRLRGLLGDVDLHRGQDVVVLGCRPNDDRIVAVSIEVQRPAGVEVVLLRPRFRDRHRERAATDLLEFACFHSIE
jgi:hypothetical protein